jgi:hypothetical protein
MIFTDEDKKNQKKLDSMTALERDMMIRRLEKERKKVNAEIESILKSYAKESGNKQLIRRRMRRRRYPNDFDFAD